MKKQSNTFQDNLDIRHLEVGAGCGDFGRRFFPDCYLTDSESLLFTQCNPQFLDRIANAHEIPWPSDRFKHIILCNPYGYGFRDISSGRQLLSEFCRVLQHKSDITILGKDSNKYCRADIVAKAAESISRGKITVQVVSTEEIDPKREYTDFDFYTTGRVSKTIPNLRISLHVTKIA